MVDPFLETDVLQDSSVDYVTEAGADQTVEFADNKDAFLSGSSSEKKENGAVTFKLGESPQYDLAGFQQLDLKDWEKVNEGHLTNLAEGTISLINKTLNMGPDTIFFLDKSARPAAYLFRETWRRLLPEKELPKICFINIGSYQNQENDGSLDQLRKKFVGLEEDNILVANESVITGESLNRAVDTVGKLFPKAKSVTGTVIYERAPLWNGKPEHIGVVENENYDAGLDISDNYLVKPYRDNRYPEKTKALRDYLSRFAADIAKNAVREEGYEDEQKGGIKRWASKQFRRFLANPKS